MIDQLAHKCINQTYITNLYRLHSRATPESFVFSASGSHALHLLPTRAAQREPMKQFGTIGWLAREPATDSKAQPRKHNQSPAAQREPRATCQEPAGGPRDTATESQAQPHDHSQSMDQYGIKHGVTRRATRDTATDSQAQPREPSQIPATQREPCKESTRSQEPHKIPQPPT